MPFAIIGGVFVFVFVAYLVPIVRFNWSTTGGFLALDQGDLDAAEKYFRRGLRLAHRASKRTYDCEVFAWFHLALIAQRRGDLKETAQCAGRALQAMDHGDDTDKRYHVVFAYIAELLEANGEFADAVSFRQYAASSMAERLKASEPGTLALANLARALEYSGRTGEAAQVRDSIPGAPQGFGSAGDAERLYRQIISSPPADDAPAFPEPAAAGEPLVPLLRAAASGLEEQASRPTPKPSGAVEQPSLEEPSLVGRALLAVALTAGLFLLVLGCAVFFGWMAFRQIQAGSYWAIGHVIALYTLAASVWRARDRFTPPGPELRAEDQPELFRVLEEVARFTGQPMPAAVYLAPGSSAFVTQHGGRFGFGARRVMGLSLANLQILTVDQFRSVIAHEFGHFAASDTVFSAWICGARSAALNTWHSLHGAGGFRLLFEIYAKVFLRVTMRIGRQQEFAADRMAARLTGPRIASDALRASYGSLYGWYCAQELEPVLERGLLPPLCDGLEAFNRHWADKLGDPADEDASARTSDPYDTHPPLAMRLEALSRQPAHEPAHPDTRTAIALLRNLPELEHRIIESDLGTPEGGWRRIGWDYCTEHVFLPGWRAEAARFADLFAHAGMAEMPSLLERLTARVGGEHFGRPTEEARGYAVTLGIYAAGLALVRDGWTALGAPGTPTSFVKHSRRLDPGGLLHGLHSGRLSESDWLAAIREADVATLPLNVGRAEAETRVEVQV